MRSQRMDGVHKSLASAFGEEDGVLQHDLEALDRRRLLGASSGLPLGAVDRQHTRLQLEIANQTGCFEWLTASGTWFGEIPVCCCLTSLAWLPGRFTKPRT